MIGRTIAHYKILEKLGEGGMGVVYKAEDTKLRRSVALKFLPRHALDSEEYRARFLLEAQAAAALDHPNICTVFGIDEVDGQLFIAMAYVDGESLKAKIKSGKLTLVEAVQLAIHAARGLAEAHEKGIVHRDVKSANILVTAKGQAKITDFGLALLLERTQITKVGATMGTVAYMSPEQARGERVDHRSDIWSLGVVLYEMATGQLPFRGDREPAVVHSILHSEPATTTSAGAKMTRDLDRILRRALAKSPADRYARVEEMLEELETLRLALDPGAVTTTRTTGPLAAPSRRRYLYGGLAALAALLAAGGYLWFRQSPPPPAAALASIAVLPLENLSRDPEQEYFTDGMTRALIAQLAKIGALRVTSRTSVMQYQGSKRSLRDIAKELTVDAVLEGSVSRAGNKVRITVQLIGAATDQLLWAETYDRDLRDIFTLQSEVARAVAGEIRVKLTPQEQARLAGVPAVNPRAYEAYLKGRHHWNKRTEEALRKGLEYFQQALFEDPRYAQAYAGVADSYFLLGWSGAMPPREAMPEAKKAAERALKIDDKLAEAHNSLAGVLQLYDWDWAAAEREFRRAIELDPASADARHRYAMNCLAPLGRLDEAAREMQRAQDLDALSLVIRTNVARPLYLAGRYDEAIQHYRGVIELEPNFFRAHWELGRAYEQKGRCGEAIAAYEQARTLSRGSPFVIGGLGHAYGRCGQTAAARKLAAELLELSKRRYVSPFDIALVHAGLDDTPAALDWLERAYQERSVWMVYLKIDPRLERLRAEPRYVALMKKVGLEK